MNHHHHPHHRRQLPTRARPRPRPAASPSRVPCRQPVWRQRQRPQRRLHQHQHRLQRLQRRHQQRPQRPQRPHQHRHHRSRLRRLHFQRYRRLARGHRQPLHLALPAPIECFPDRRSARPVPRQRRLHRRSFPCLAQGRGAPSLHGVRLARAVPERQHPARTAHPLKLGGAVRLRPPSTPHSRLWRKGTDRLIS